MSAVGPNSSMPFSSTPLLASPHPPKRKATPLTMLSECPERAAGTAPAQACVVHLRVPVSCSKSASAPPASASAPAAAGAEAIVRVCVWPRPACVV